MRLHADRITTMSAPSPRLRPQARRLAVRSLTLAGMLLLLSAIPACQGIRRDFTFDEAELVAWYVEDVAHGALRRPEELITASPSEGLLQIAQWARGRSTGEAADLSQQPRQLEARRRRWPVLRGMITGGLVTVAAGGRLVLAGQATPHERDLVLGIISDEERERDAIDVLVLNFSHAGNAAARRYRDAVFRARQRHDRQAAAWTEGR
jgi:hypothetical protein